MEFTPALPETKPYIDDGEENKRASLEATLVQNYDRVTDGRTHSVVKSVELLA